MTKFGNSLGGVSTLYSSTVLSELIGELMNNEWGHKWLGENIVIGSGE